MTPSLTRSSTKRGKSRKHASSKEKPASAKRVKANKVVGNKELNKNEEVSVESDDKDNIQLSKPDSAPVLSKDAILMVDSIITGLPDEKVVENFGLAITVRDLSLYKNSEWLEDRNVDFYLEMIRERNNQKDSGLKKVFIYHGIFYPLLIKRGYDAVMGFTEEVDLFDYDLAFFPINHSCRHWSLVVVDFGKSNILHYDSLGSSRARISCYVKHIWKYLENESLIRREVELDGWQAIKFEEDEIPCQDGWNDCGIFMLQYANYISREAKFDFKQEHVPYFRKRMAYETIETKLLD